MEAMTINNSTTVRAISYILNNQSKARSRTTDPTIIIRKVTNTHSTRSRSISSTTKEAAAPHVGLGHQHLTYQQSTVSDVTTATQQQLRMSKKEIRVLICSRTCTSTTYLLPISYFRSGADSSRGNEQGQQLFPSPDLY